MAPGLDWTVVGFVAVSPCIALGACTTEGVLFNELGTGGAASSDAGKPSGPLSPSSSPPSVQNATEGSCSPGHYVGTFSGVYNSAAWGNGSLPLSVAAKPSMGRPGLEFWLEKANNDCKEVEFCPEFTLRSGKIRGFANPFSDGNSSGSDGFAIAVRFEIDFGGELDCTRGQLRGLLQNGCYDAATVLFRFEGTAPASYDHRTSSFTDGQWSVKEMPMAGVLFPPGANIGGMGVWQASLMSDTSAPVDASSGLCHD